MSSLKTNPRESLEELKTYPVFQNLRAKAETHQLQFRPKESLKLQNNGTLNQVLDSRTESAWNSLRDCRPSGMNQPEAEEVAYQNILLPSEQEEEQERLDPRHVDTPRRSMAKRHATNGDQPMILRLRRPALTTMDFLWLQSMISGHPGRWVHRAECAWV